MHFVWSKKTNDSEVLVCGHKYFVAKESGGVNKSTQLPPLKQILLNTSREILEFSNA